MDFTQLISYFKEILDKIVVKYGYTAKSLDTLEIVQDFQRYEVCLNEKDNFYTHENYPEEVLISAGITDEKFLTAYSLDKYLIPESYHEEVLKAYRKYIISNYEEQNEYYRELIGLPPLSHTEDDFFYAPSDIAEEYGIDDTIPIHELDTASVMVLHDLGFIKELISANPKVGYLNYLGTNAMNLVEIRNARNYELLRMPNGLPESFYKLFVETYAAARDYILTIFYIKEYNAVYDQYENFIALCIVTVCLLRVSTKMVDNLIQRNFFDLKSIIMFFEAYGIPYVDTLNFSYQQLLARNVNYLLRYKSTNLAIQDVASILGFSGAQITEYYLVKEQHLDGNDEPLFYYKDAVDSEGNVILGEDGNPQQELDYEKTFDIYFEEVSLDEENVQLAISSDANRVDYDVMVSSDPFWVDDADLRKAVYENNYNYEETKYIGLSVTYKITEMIFEVCNVFRMIMDNKDRNTFELKVSMAKLSSENVSLFDAFVLLFALLCKRNKLAGNIASTPSKVSAVVGFNFYADFKEVRNDIIETCEKHPELMSEDDKNKLLSYLSKLSIATIEDINTIFGNIKDLNRFLLAKMNDANTLKEFNVYRKLYDTLLVVDDVTTMFTKSNGEVATTFADYLDSEAHVLYNYLMQCEGNSITTTISYIVYQLQGFCDEIGYLDIATNDSDTISKALKKFINFFKSYTADLISMNTTYLLNSRFENYLRTLHDIKLITKTMQIPDYDMKKTYSDTAIVNKTLQVGSHETDSLFRGEKVRIIRD